MPVLAAIYDRVSKDAKRRSRSVEQQETENRAACDAHGWPVAGVYTDNDRSASRFAAKARPDWLRLVADLDAGRFHVLVMWEPSRGSRDLEVWAALLRVCRERGVSIYVTSHQRMYDPGNARDWRSLAEDAVDSAYESEKTSTRILRDMRARAQEGKPHGFVAYGWTREFLHGADGRVIGSRDVIDGDAAAVIREATKRVIRGESLRSIATDLNTRGVPSPRGKRWDSVILRQVLLRERNAGRRVHRGEVVGKGTWEPIVSEDRFDTLRGILTDESRIRNHGVTVSKYLLSGLARCGRPGCDGRMRAIVHEPSRTDVYVCVRCHKVRRRRQPVDELVTAVTVARLAMPDVVAALATAVDTSELVERRDALRARLDLAADDYADGKIDNRQLQRITGKLAPQIAAAEAEIRAASSTPDLLDLARPDIAKLWAGVPLERRRAVIDTLMTVTIMPVGSGARWDPSSVRIDWRTA